MEIVLFVAIGAVLGALGGLTGIGGSLFAVVLLGLAFHFDQHVAQGTAIVMATPAILLGLGSYVQRKNIDIRLALMMAFAAPLSTYFGARIAVHVDVDPLRHAFAIFLVVVSGALLWRALAPPSQARNGRVPWFAAISIAFVCGVFSGLFSGGGSILAVAVLTLLFSTQQAVAQGLGFALLPFGAIAASATYASSGNVDWAAAIPLAAGSMLGVTRGVALAHHLPERWLRLVFALIMIFSAAGLWFRR